MGRPESPRRQPAAYGEQHPSCIASAQPEEAAMTKARAVEQLPDRLLAPPPPEPLSVAESVTPNGRGWPVYRYKRQAGIAGQAGTGRGREERRSEVS